MKHVNEVGKLTGVSRRTLQYYDDEDVVKAERSNNNYRLYDDKSLEQLWEVLIYKKMGFELKEIRKLIVVSESEKNKFLELQMQKITVKKQAGKKMESPEGGSYGVNSSNWNTELR